MKKAILFDIDGTLLDVWDFVLDAVKHSLTVHGYPYPKEQDMRKAMGKPIIEFYQVLLPEADPLMLAQAHHAFQKENFHLIKPFPNTKETLKVVKDSGFFIAAVSNRIRESLLHSLKLTGISDYFDVVVSADDVANPKPHEEHLLVALDRFKIKPANAYMVGDTDQDILAGKNARVKTIGATYGFLGKDIAKYNPDYLIDNIKELLQILNLIRF